MRAAKNKIRTLLYIEENHDNQVYTSKNKQKTVGTTGLARGAEVRLKVDTKVYLKCILR
jgi:hypothetical protein